MIEVDRLCCRQGSFTLTDISFRIESGQYVVLMGPSGRGKTTILELICGLRKALSGSISIDGRDVTSRSPAERSIGYVPQDFALFPNLDVYEHLAFALRLRRYSAQEIHQRVAELAELLGIEHLLKRSIVGLSGGESQRVTLGRALSFKPPVLLLDEPLSALDERTRVEMHRLLSDIKRATRMTTLHVTHNQAEADALADRVLELKDGQVVERSDAHSS